MKPRNDSRAHAKVPVVLHGFAAVIPHGLRVLEYGELFPCIGFWMQGKRGTLSFRLDAENIERLHRVQLMTKGSRSEIITAAILGAQFAAVNYQVDLTTQLPVPAWRRRGWASETFEGGGIPVNQRQEYIAGEWRNPEEAIQCRIYGVTVPEGTRCDTPCDLTAVDAFGHQLPSWCPLNDVGPKSQVTP